MADNAPPLPPRIVPPRHLAHCAEADGRMAVGGPCHRAFLDELRARVARDATREGPLAATPEPRPKRQGGRATAAAADPAAKAARRAATGAAARRPTAGEAWRRTGPAMWAELEAWARGVDAAVAAGTGYAGWEAVRWLRAFRRRIGCGACGRHWDEMTKRTPPPLWGRPGSMAAWASNRHNEVSARIGKPVWGLVVWRPAT